MTQTFMPTGTVYGTLLNFKAELAAMQPQMNQPPYKAPPQAPVLYVKPANTWSANGASIAVPARVPEVEIGATIAMVMSTIKQDSLCADERPVDPAQQLFQAAGEVQMSGWIFGHRLADRLKRTSRKISNWRFA